MSFIGFCLSAFLLSALILNTYALSCYVATSSTVGLGTPTTCTTETFCYTTGIYIAPTPGSPAGSNLFSRGCVATCTSTGTIANGTARGLFCCQTDNCNTITGSSTTTAAPITVTYIPSSFMKTMPNKFLVFMSGLMPFVLAFKLKEF